MGIFFRNPKQIYKKIFPYKNFIIKKLGNQTLTCIKTVSPPIKTYVFGVVKCFDNEVVKRVSFSKTLCVG